MRRVSVAGLVGLVPLAALAAVAEIHAADLPLPQRILFVGTPGSERTAAFTQFIEQHFRTVAVADRDRFDRASAEEADVVVLDWSQSDGNLQEAVSPLGDLEDWNKPTVFLGSAGLLMAACWEVIGGAG